MVSKNLDMHISVKEMLILHKVVIVTCTVHTGGAHGETFSSAAYSAELNFKAATILKRKGEKDHCGYSLKNYLPSLAPKLQRHLKSCVN